MRLLLLTLYGVGPLTSDAENIIDGPSYRPTVLDSFQILGTVRTSDRLLRLWHGLGQVPQPDVKIPEDVGGSDSMLIIRLSSKLPAPVPGDFGPTGCPPSMRQPSSTR